MRLRLGGGCVVALCVLAMGAAGRADAIAVTEFPLPVPNSGPRDVAAGPDGNIWFTEVQGSRVGRITQAGGVTDFSSGSGVATGGEKWGIAAGPDGNLWYTDQKLAVVGRITPFAAGVEFPVALSPAGLGPRGIAAGPDGNLWVAADGGAIIRVTQAGVPSEFTAGISAGSRPLDIAAGPDGNLWFTELFGRHIGRITTAGVVTEFGTGISPDALLSGIVAGPDGALWFTDLLRRVGRITTAGVVTEFTLPPLAQPRAITAGPDGNLWFTDESRRLLGRITTAGVVTEYPLTLANAGQPHEITTGPDRDLWFTTSGERIVRVRLQPAVTTGTASAVTMTSARIAGTVDPFASSTGYVVEYGRTTAYGSATGALIVPPSAGALPVVVPLGGLAPGTRYHYRLVGSSFAGTTEGADGTFTTAGAPGTGGRGGGGPSGDRAGPRMRIGGAALVARHGRASVSLGCPLAETLGCRGRVRLVTASTRRTPLRLGSAPFRLGGGQARAVAIRLTPRARALLRARKALRVRAVAVAVDAAGNERTTLRRLVLRSAAP